MQLLEVAYAALRQVSHYAAALHSLLPLARPRALKGLKWHLECANRGFGRVVHLAGSLENTCRERLSRSDGRLSPRLAKPLLELRTRHILWWYVIVYTTSEDALWNNQRQRRFDCNEFLNSTITDIAR